MMTDHTPDRHHPSGGQEPATVLAEHAAGLDKPAWAAQLRYYPDVAREGSVVFRWAAPVLELDDVEVEAVQHRFLTLLEGGAVSEEAQAAQVHCDAGDLWLTPAGARAFAAALVACADRLDGAA